MILRKTLLPIFLLFLPINCNLSDSKEPIPIAPNTVVPFSRPPRVSLDQLKFIGAFRLPVQQCGASSIVQADVVNVTLRFVNRTGGLLKTKFVGKAMGKSITLRDNQRSF